MNIKVNELYTTGTNMFGNYVYPPPSASSWHVLS